MSKNTALWDDVKVPVKGSLKKVTTRGGFTSINAQHQVEYATEKFGPMGSSWGLMDCEWDIVRNAEGTPVQLTLDAVFYYPEYTGSNDETSPSGEFQISSDIEWSARGECRKKLRTDLLTKALSQIGFSSDVFKNLWDGDRYTGTNPEEANQPAKVSGPDKDEATKLIEKAKSMAQVKKIATSCKERAIAEKWINHLSGLVKLRQDEFDAK